MELSSVFAFKPKVDSAFLLLLFKGVFLLMLIGMLMCC